MKLLITGPQGSGKTTQVKIISERLGLCFVKTGDIVRERAQKNDEIGSNLKQALESGQLADDEIITSLVEEKLKKPQCISGFVMDGYPRSMVQLKVFDPGFDKVIYLDISDEEAIRRMLKRGREDDTLELIKERLRIYKEETKKVLDHYQSLGKLIRIDGEQTEEQVTEDILESLQT